MAPDKPPSEDPNVGPTTWSSCKRHQEVRPSPSKCSNGHASTPYFDDWSTNNKVAEPFCFKPDLAGANKDNHNFSMSWRSPWQESKAAVIIGCNRQLSADGLCQERSVASADNNSSGNVKSPPLALKVALGMGLFEMLLSISRVGSGCGASLLPMRSV